MAKSLVLEKAIKFALRIVRLHKYLTEEKKEYVLSKQLLLSGTFIAKHLKAATQAPSREGFASQVHIAFNKASETELWLLLLHEGEFIDDKMYQSINDDCVELIKMTSSISKTTVVEGVSE